jgi:hypothetical protein
MHATLADAAVAMAAPADILFPDPAAAACLDHGYAVFRTMQRQRSELDRLTAGPVTGVTAAPSAPR